MKSLTEKLIPELRFPEFNGEWSSDLLENILEFKNGINASAEDYGIGIKFINVLDILNNDYITYEKIMGKINIKEDKFKENKVNYGDVVFQRSSETREEVGMSNIYLDNKPATFGGFVIRGKKINEYDPVFLGYLLKTSRIRKQMEMLAGGSTRFNIGQKELRGIEYTKPSLEEQEKIGDFLYSIDEKLKLQRKRIDKLREYKKGMMQRIFSQEIRFKDENGNDYPGWEEKKLADMGKVITGGTPKTGNEDNFGNEYLWATPLDLGSDKYILETNRTLSGKGLQGIRSTSKGSVLVTCIGSTIGKLGISIETMGTNQQINSIECIPDHDNEFLYYNLLFNNHLIIRYASVQAVPIINKTTLSKLKFKFPIKEEQTKIANFLSSIDKKIKLEEEKLELQQEFKKGLMQRMFI